MCSLVVEHWSRERVMWVRIPPGAAHFSLKRRESEPSHLVFLCCLALFTVSQLSIMYMCIIYTVACACGEGALCAVRSD